MRRLAPVLLICAPTLFLCAFPTSAQIRGPLHPPDTSDKPSESENASSAPVINVPRGTKITIAMTKPVWSRTAKPGDAIYGVTAFPAVVGDQMAVPPGTYVQGVIDTITRPGRSSRAQFELHFSEFIFANGYFVPLGDIPPAPGANSAPAVGTSTAETGTTATGSDPVQMAYLAEQGGLSGAPTAMVYVNVSPRSDVLLDNGTQFDMVLQKPLQLDAARIANAVSVSKAPLLTQFKSATQCRFIPGTPGTPGTSDTVIPGSPGTPATIIPGVNGFPDTVIPGIPAAPATVIPGTPGTPGTPDATCPGPPAVTSAPADTARHSKSFAVTNSLLLNGQPLTRGNYKATWTGSGPAVQLLITRKKTPDISIAAHLVTLPAKAPKNFLTPRASAGGSASVESVQFKGQTFALYFDAPPPSNSAASAVKPPGHS